MNFSQRLRELRKVNNVTQSQLATAIGITDRACRRYESGENEPTMSIINSIANYFNVSTDYLLCRGIFGKENFIMLHKEKIIESLCLFYNTDFFRQTTSLPNNQFMILLSCAIKDIDFKEEHGEIIININPLLSPESGELFTKIVL